MEALFSEREEKIYEQLWIYRKSDKHAERSMAFDCMGVLGNESLNMTLEQRLDCVEQIFQNYVSTGKYEEW